MSGERCPRCDRAECPEFRGARDDDGTDWPHNDCVAHAVEWRSRCLAAEQERDRTRRLLVDLCDAANRGCRDFHCDAANRIRAGLAQGADR